jgi:hypothetical protein
MAIGLTWLVEQHVSFVKAWDTITPEELRQYDRDAMALLSEVTIPVTHVLFDAAETKLLPALPQILMLKAPQDARIGWVLMVAVRSAPLKVIAENTARFFQLKLRFFPTAEDGYDFLRTMYPNLPAWSSIDLAAAEARIRSQMR